MPDGAVARALEYVGLLLLLTLASTFAWWLGAQAARTEYRRVMSALACAMRVFFYSICLLCILVLARSLDIGPHDPRSTLFGWIHLGGTAWVTIPSAWRAFRARPREVAVIVAVGWVVCAGVGWAAMALSADFREVVRDLPRYLSKA